MNPLEAINLINVIIVLSLDIIGSLNCINISQTILHLQNEVKLKL